jgi:hypothetical protein
MSKKFSIHEWRANQSKTLLNERGKYSSGYGVGKVPTGWATSSPKLSSTSKSKTKDKPTFDTGKGSSGNTVVNTDNSLENLLKDSKFSNILKSIGIWYDEHNNKPLADMAEKFSNEVNSYEKRKEQEIDQANKEKADKDKENKEKKPEEEENE